MRDLARMTLSFVDELILYPDTTVDVALAERLAKRTPVTLPLRVHARFYLPMPAAATTKQREWMRNGRMRPRIAINPLLRPVLEAMCGHVVVDESCIVEQHAEAWFSEDPRVEVRLYMQIEGAH
jgi:Holliday junction resolvase RusA-like endonuclease